MDQTWCKTLVRMSLCLTAITGWLSLLLAVGCSRALVHEEAPFADSSVAVVASDVAPSGSDREIRGIVQSKESDAPLAAASVFLQAVDAGRRRAAAPTPTLTDARGRFSLAPADSGTYWLLVHLIGYHAMSREVHIGIDSGLTVVVRMAENSVQLCPLIITYPHSVAVQVIDATTGDSIRTNASLEISSGLYRAYANSEDPASQRSGDPSLLVAGDQLGPFEVIVRHPHYRTWHAHNIAPETGACGMTPASLTARMYPKRLPYPPL
jgi:hypothetical protein